MKSNQIVKTKTSNDQTNVTRIDLRSLAKKLKDSLQRDDVVRRLQLQYAQIHDGGVWTLVLKGTREMQG